jgi:hypothetical protein
MNCEAEKAENHGEWRTKEQKIIISAKGDHI